MEARVANLHALGIATAREGYFIGGYYEAGENEFVRVIHPARFPTYKDAEAFLGKVAKAAAIRLADWILPVDGVVRNVVNPRPYQVNFH